MFKLILSGQSISVEVSPMHNSSVTLGVGFTETEDPERTQLTSVVIEK